MKPLLAVIICIILLTGCTVPTATPVESTVTQDDFILTIESSQSQYALKKMFSTKPLDIKATFTYTGEDDLPIWHASQIGKIYLKIDNQIIGPEMNVELVPAVLKPDESMHITGDFSHEFYRDKFIVGDYMAVAYVDFSLNEELTEHVYMEVEIPITITK